MPTRKISDLPGSLPCRHPEHDPPGHICLPDGLYEHECPKCHSRQIFAVERPTFVSDGHHLWDARDHDPL